MVSLGLPAVVAWLCLAATANSYTVVPSESVFAVVTHKAGIASALAHNHFIYPSPYLVEASSDPAHPDQTHFRLQFPVTALVVDDPEAKARWYPGVKADGILDKPFPEVSEKDRKSIREHMLEKNQLDAEHFPNISAELKGMREKASKQGDKTFRYEVTVALTVHGKTVERPFATNIDMSGDTVHIEAVSTFQFTDFGIKPYSALLGALRNQDVFHVFVDFKAKRGK